MGSKDDQDLDELFHTLSDRTRRGILLRLAAEGELSVGQLGEPLSLAKSTVSKHLSVLERSGLVRRQVFGRDHVVQLRPQRLLAVQHWLGRTIVRNCQRRRWAREAFGRGA